MVTEKSPSSRLSVLLFGLVFLASSLQSASSLKFDASAAGRSARPLQPGAAGPLPLMFERNEGQTDPRVSYIAHHGGSTVLLTPAGAIIRLRRSGWHGSVQRTNEISDPLDTDESVISMELAGIDPAAGLVPSRPLPTRVNYFIGNNRSRWMTNVAAYARVEQSNALPGIDLVYHGEDGRFEYDFVVRPGADPAQITLSFKGDSGLDVDPGGGLMIATKTGSLVQPRPLIYQETGSGRRLVGGRFHLLADRTVGFQVDAYDRQSPLVIDPVVTYSTYLGTTGGEFANGIALGDDGSAYVAGFTDSADFPVPGGAQTGFGGGAGDAFVAKLNPGGSSLAYATYLGGSGLDRCTGIAIDQFGNAYVTGFTSSTNFPTVNPAQARNRGGNSDAFVAKLNPAGSALVYSTYLGGAGADSATRIAVDTQGSAFVTGSTNSVNFPAVNAFQPKIAGGSSDAFLVKLNQDGSTMMFSTYLGGDAGETGNDVAVDALGNAVVVGSTASENFPTVNALQPMKKPGTCGVKPNTGPCFDAFVVKFSASGSGVIFSTYLGGTLDDRGSGIAIDKERNVYLTGTTLSEDFPLARALQPDFAGAGTNTGDAWVAKLNSSGSALIYSTFLGGSSGDAGSGIAVDGAGNAFVSGDTASVDFPVFRPVQRRMAGSSGGNDFGDAFVAKLNPLGSSLIFSTYLGGSGTEHCDSIRIDSLGNAYIDGVTFSTNFPVANALQPTFGGIRGSAGDAFIAKITE